MEVFLDFYPKTKRVIFQLSPFGAALFCVGRLKTEYGPE